MYLVPRLLKQPECSSVAPDVPTAADMTRFRECTAFKLKKNKKTILFGKVQQEKSGSALVWMH